MPSVILFNKPFGVLSQFRADPNRRYATLGDFFDDKSLRVAGRLDAASEGLLLLCADGKLGSALTRPLPVADIRFARPDQGKTYWVQVEGDASAEQIERLRRGVPLKDGVTLPALVDRLDPTAAATLWQAPPPIATAVANRRASWLCITLFEGKNRQIRRMTAAVGLPCLRLVRVGSRGFFVQGIGVGKFVRVFVDAKKITQWNARR